MSKEHNVPVDVIEISNVSIRDGSKKGDGFACEIAAVQFQAGFNGQVLEKNYIAKYVDPNAKRAEMLKLVKYFACFFVVMTFVFISKIKVNFNTIEHLFILLNFKAFKILTTTIKEQMYSQTCV